MSDTFWGGADCPGTALGRKDTDGPGCCLGKGRGMAAGHKIRS